MTTQTTRQAAPNKVAQLRAELEQEEAKVRELDALIPEQQLATEIHDLVCNSEHTETCGWFYEKWDQGPHWTRTRYLEKARNILNITDVTTALAVLAEAEKF